MSTVRVGVGWQYALADLSLILFMVCAAALSRQIPPPPPPVTALPNQPVALAEPVAVWRAAPDGPTLEAWLAGQSLDPRQRLTIVARYSGGRAQEAFVRAQREVRSLPPMAAATRIVVEPATIDDLSATLAWDAGG
jgi:hypothetical protein